MNKYKDQMIEWINSPKRKKDLKIKIKKLHQDVKIPEYMTDGSSGMDICAFLPGNSHEVSQGRTSVISTKIALAIPKGYEAQIRPRSGMAKRGIIGILGTIDSDYTGEIKVILINNSEDEYLIGHGDRIAQLVFQKVEKATLEEVEELDKTERGTGGFGHTGK